MALPPLFQAVQAYFLLIAGEVDEPVALLKGRHRELPQRRPGCVRPSGHRRF